MIVETTHGSVRGAAEGDHVRFRGIPFASPPTGERRFRAPEPAEPWSGVRDALEFGGAAPQNESLLPGMEPGPQSEDCLYLNVYTPAIDAERRPVMVWIHGGGFTGGSGAQAIYDGARLAARGDVVLVTVNYRLGVLGYLSAAGVDSNVGQLDQIAALEWVRDNIEAFGGDPDNVTIFGESAGGMAVATLLAMPRARGLFHKAIPQSGAAHHVHSRESAGRVADLVLDALGARDVEALRALPVEELLRAQASALEAAAGQAPGLAFAPVLDENTLPRHPLDAVRDGEARDVALLVGHTRDEIKLFRIGTPVKELDDERLARRVSRSLHMAGADPVHAEPLIDAYRKAREGRASTEPNELYDAIDTDRMFRIPAIRLLEAHRAHQPESYAYLFSWESPAVGGRLGSCHALELPFVFGTLDAPTMDRFCGSGPDAERLSDRMMYAWVAFARSGRPECPGVAHWPAYCEERRSTLVFDREVELVERPFDDERAAWEGLI